MAPEQSSQTEAPVAPSVSPLSSTRQPTPLIQPPQRASHQPLNNNNVQNPYGLYPQSYGSHYVPYDQTAPQQLRQMQQQQQQMPMQQNGQQVTYMTVPQPFQQPPETNRRMITKDVFHVMILIMTIIGIGFSFSLIGTGISQSGNSNGYYYDDLDYYLPAMSAGPIFIIALLWSLAELVVRCSRNWKAGIHPGAHVGVCLCIWLGAVIVGALLTTLVAVPDYYGSCYSGSSSSSYSSRRCYRSQNAMFVGSTVLVFLVAVVEIIIFIIACTDTHVRNKWKRSVVIASTPYWAPPPQGYYVAPGQQMHQQMPQQTYQQMPQQQFMPMGQAPAGQVPMTQVQQPMMANTRAAQTPAGSQPVVAHKGENGEVQAQPEHSVKEFYTPGTAQ